MLDRCGLLGLRRHVLPEGYARGLPYLVPIFLTTDGINREHWELRGECARCGRLVSFARVHGPLRAEVERLNAKAECEGEPVRATLMALKQQLAASQAIVSRLDQELAAKHPVYTLRVLQHIKGVV